MYVTAGAAYLSRTLYRGLRPDTDFVQDVVEGIKHEDVASAEVAAGWFTSDRRELRRQGVLVVPVPRSTPGRHTYPFAACMGAILGREVQPLLFRATPVPSSRLLRRQGREGVSVKTHVASLAAVRPEISGVDLPLLLVDDVFTRGNTLVACTRVLRRVGWRGPISGVVAAQAVDATELTGEPALGIRGFTVRAT